MRKKKRDNILAIITLVVAFIGFKMYSEHKGKEIDLLSNQGCVTVGEIVKRNLPGALGNSKIIYDYYFFIKGVRVEGWGSDYKKISLGSYFEVTYLPDNPQKSRMEFSRPILADSVCTYFENECPFEIGKK